MGKRRKGPAPFLPASAGGGNVNAAATSSMLALSSSLAGTRLSVPPSPYGSRGPKFLRREGCEAQTGVSGWTQSRHLQQPARPCCTSNTAYPHANSHGTEQNNEVSFCPSSSNPEELRWAKAEPSSAAAAAGGVRATQLLAGLLCCCLSRAQASLRDVHWDPLRAVSGRRWNAPEKTWQRSFCFWYSLQGPAPLINTNKLL